MKNVVILVHSCDYYKEAWYPFFSLFHKYWEECPYEIYLSTESECFEFEGVRVIQTGGGSWSRRLNIALKSIESDNILFFLEDFFFQREVNTVEINRAVRIIKQNEDIACLYFNRITGYSEKSHFDGYIEMRPEKNSVYMLNCQAALWKKEVLEIVTNLDMSPWEFEQFGYERCKEKIKGNRFLCYANSYYDKLRENDIFPYLLVRDSGYGIWKSKWLWNNEKLFHKNGIKFRREKLKKYSRASYLVNKIYNRLVRGM